MTEEILVYQFDKGQNQGMLNLRGTIIRTPRSYLMRETYMCPTEVRTRRVEVVPIQPSGRAVAIVVRDAFNREPLRQVVLSGGTKLPRDIKVVDRASP